MSRDFRDDARDDRPAREIEPVAVIPREPGSASRDLFGHHLELPRGETRERFDGRQRDHRLDKDETRALATIGAFRVVSADDLVGSGSGISDADLRHLCVLPTERSALDAMPFRIM